MLVQTFISQAALEALDECVLKRLPRLNELEMHAKSVRPGVHRLAMKLRFVVQNNAGRISAARGDPVEHLNYRGIQIHPAV